ncbi:MAG: hypothetical protein WC718_05615 [Phycisphaerales bacterium]|jgi:hypothetical protein
MAFARFAGAPRLRQCLGGVAALLVLAAGSAPAAAQDVNTLLTYEVSSDNISWGSSVNVLPSDTVYVRTLLTYTGPGTAAGVGQVIFQPVVSSWHSTDAVLNSAGSTAIEPLVTDRNSPLRGYYPEPGIWGRTRTFSAVAYSTSTFLRGHLGSGTAAGLLRIARADVTNWIGEGPTSGALAANNWNGGGGVNIGQIANPSRISSDPAFDASTDRVLVFGFAVQLDATPGSRTLDISTPAGGIGRVSTAGPTYGEQNARWFASTTEVSSSLRGGVEVIDAHINVIPAPGAVALASLGGLLVLRRRSRR